MNEKNLEFLKDQVQYTGFGNSMENVLRENLLKGEKEFKINHELKFGNDTIGTTLNFKKSDQSDIYFFNSYQVNLHKDDSKEALQQTFYINKSNNITAKEAYNLMEGRSVNKDLKNKEGEVYNSWLKLDFKESDTSGNFKINHYHQNYGYDLEASLQKHPIKELENPQYKEDLLNSLKKGNLQSVTFVMGDTEKKQFVEANPHFKTVNVYDGSMQRINTREHKDQKQTESEQKSQSKDTKQKQDVDSDAPDSGQKSNTRKKKHSKSI